MVFGGKDADIGPRPAAADMDHARRACRSGAFVHLFCNAGAGLRDSPASGCSQSSRYCGSATVADSPTRR